MSQASSIKAIRQLRPEKYIPDLFPSLPLLSNTLFLRPQIKAIHQLRQLFWVPIEKKLADFSALMREVFFLKSQVNQNFT